MAARPGEERPLSLESVGLVAIDLDGTLLRCDGSICLHAAEAIAEAVERGVKIVIATGRSPRSLLGIYQGLGLDTPIICHNGALILDPPARRVLYHETLAADTARRVMQIGRRVYPEIAIGLEVFDRCHTRNSLKATAPAPQINIAAALEAEVEAPHGSHSAGAGSAGGAMDIASLNGSALAMEALSEPEDDALAIFEPVLATPGGITKVMFTGEPDVLGGIQTSLESALGGEVSFACSHMHLLQVVHHAAHKAAAIEQVAGRYGVARSGVMAIGDAPNDLSMIRWAGLGIATGNAWPEVQAAAHCVVLSNEDAGVAYAIRKYVLQQQ